MITGITADPLFIAMIAGLLFVIGVFGIVLNRRNVIAVLMAIEIILLSVNVNFIGFSRLWGALDGQVFTMFVLTVAAAEAAIGLAILVVFFRQRGDIAIESLSTLRG